MIQLNEEIADYGVWGQHHDHPRTKIGKGQKHAVGAWIKLASEAGENTGQSCHFLYEHRQCPQKLGCRNSGMELQRSATGILRHLEPGIGANRGKRKQRKKKVKFYSALYNAHFLPRTFSDVDGSYPRFDGDGQIMKMDHGTYYCDFSQWDTYRAVHPLFSILTPSRNRGYGIRSC